MGCGVWGVGSRGRTASRVGATAECGRGAQLRSAFTSDEAFSVSDGAFARIWETTCQGLEM